MIQSPRMKSFLKTTLSVIALIIVLSAIGLSIEWFRRRSIQKWAQSQGGTFEPGSLLGGLPLPESAPFHSEGGKFTYSNVSRFVRPEASYVVAQYENRWQDFRNEWKTVSYVVCFVTLPSGAWPGVKVHAPMGGFLSELIPRSEASAPLKVPEATPAFAAKFQVLPGPGAGEISPEALARLLPTAVQQELLAQESLIAGFQVRGNVARVAAVSRETGYPHREVFDAARRLGAIWGSR